MAPPLCVVLQDTRSKVGQLLGQEAAVLVEELERRVEEGDLAAAVQTRRAGTAEVELARCKEQLAEANRQVGAIRAGGGEEGRHNKGAEQGGG